MAVRVSRGKTRAGTIRTECDKAFKKMLDIEG